MMKEGFTVNERLPDTLVDVAVWHVFKALCQPLLMRNLYEKMVDCKHFTIHGKNQAIRDITRLLKISQNRK